MVAKGGAKLIDSKAIQTLKKAIKKCSFDHTKHSRSRNFSRD